jgi:hypothetical protein
MKSNILIFVAVWLLMLLFTWYKHNEQQKKIKHIQSKTKKLYEQNAKETKDQKTEEESDDTGHAT